MTRYLTKWYAGRQLLAMNAAQGARRVIIRSPQTANGEFHMSKKIVSTAILAGLLFGLAAPIAQAKSAPKTKAECEKMTNMKWDDATSKCVKK
jgi:hypothetical protein